MCGTNVCRTDTYGPDLCKFCVLTCPCLVTLWSGRHVYLTFVFFLASFFGMLLVRGFASNPRVDREWVTLPSLVVVTTPWDKLTFSCSVVCGREWVTLPFRFQIFTTPWVNWPFFYFFGAPSLGVCVDSMWVTLPSLVVVTTPWDLLIFYLLSLAWLWVCESLLRQTVSYPSFSCRAHHAMR